MADVGGEVWQTDGEDDRGGPPSFIQSSGYRSPTTPADAVQRPILVY